MQVNKMLTDSKGNLWLGSEDDGVKTIYRYKDMFNSMPALQRAIGKQPVLSVAADRNHHLWISTKKNGLYMYDLQTQQLKDIPMVSYSNGNKKNAIINIFVDSSNHLWLANGDHVAKYQYDGNNLNKVAPTLASCLWTSAKMQRETSGIHGIRQHLLHFSTKWRDDQKTTLPYHFVLHSLHHALAE